MRPPTIYSAAVGWFSSCGRSSAQKKVMSEQMLKVLVHSNTSNTIEGQKLATQLL